MAGEKGEPAGMEEATPPQLVAQLQGLVPSKEADVIVKRLIKLAEPRTVGEVAEFDNCIQFLADYPPDSDWRALTNLARRIFDVDIKTPELSVCGRFTSVEGLFQGLKFNLTEQFAEGGLLEGEKAGSVLEPLKEGMAAKIANRRNTFPFAEGYVALQVSRLLLRAKPGTATAPELATLARRRATTLAQADSGLLLFACKLLMYTQVPAACELLAATGDKAIEEYNDGEHGPDFYSRYRPADGKPPEGSNAAGQNLMHVRKLLRSAGGVDRCKTLSTTLFQRLSAAIVGGEVLSPYAARFYADPAMTYSQLLELAAPCADDGGPSRDLWL